MQVQYDNRVMSSLMLWLDNKILTKGTAFTNHSSRFYRIGDAYSNYYTYALPFKQVVSDSSIPGANIMSGIYLNGTFITTGVSGLVNINYAEGQVYFSSALPASTVISGNYAVKDFNIYLTNEAEEQILFENAYKIRPRINQTLTGLAVNAETLPAIFLKNNGGTNEGFAFGGTDMTTMYVRGIVLADSQYLLDAACCIMRDTNLSPVALFQPSEMPFDGLGGYRSGILHYNSLALNKPTVFINSVTVSRYNSRSIVMTEIARVNPGIFPALIDFEIQSIRNPRA